MTSHDVVTIGEAMLRLSPPPGISLSRATSLDVHMAGSEANVAVCLAALGRSVAWLSVLPANRLGRRVARDLTAAGVDLDGVRWEADGRLGTYYVEPDTGPRGVSIIYDRAGSTAAAMGPDRIDWDLVRGARIVHLSGITAALSEACRRTVFEAADVARSGSGLLTVDVNYRARLWPAGKARSAISAFAEGADLLICTLEDARDVFGIHGSAEDAATALADSLHAKRVIVTRGAEGAVLLDVAERATFAAVPTTIRDRLGAGDAFVAGVLDGLLDGDVKVGVERGLTLAAVALATAGDLVDISRDELNAAMRSAARTVDR